MNRQTKLGTADRMNAAPLLLALLVISLAFLPYSVGLRAQAKNQAKAAAKGKWVTLFDGKSMANWTPSGDANWRLMDGAAVADKGMGYLVSRNSYTDFEVRAEFWVSDNANSGVFIRCAGGWIQRNANTRVHLHLGTIE